MAWPEPTAVTAAAITLDPYDVFAGVGYAPHAGQRKIHNSAARNRVVAAGRRTGKSVAGGNEIVVEAFPTFMNRTALEDRGVRREFWIVGPEYSDAEKEFRVVWNGAKKLGIPFDRPGCYYNANQGELHFSAFNGLFQVHGKSGRKEETLVGEGLSGVIVAEAAKLKQRVWLKSIRPTLSDFKGWALFSSTPEGRNWFYDIWNDGQNPLLPDWWSVRMPSWQNPVVYPKGATKAGITRLRWALSNGAMLTEALCNELGVDPEIGQQVADLTEETFNQEIAADFNEYVGRVFKDWDEEEHVGDFVQERGSHWHTYGAVDWGFTNPTVYLTIQYNSFTGDIRVLNEYYERERTPEQAAAECVARGIILPGTECFYPDPASPGDSNTFSDKVRIPWRRGTGGEQKMRIAAIRNALKVRNLHAPLDDPLRTPALMVDRSCKNLIAEMGKYRYPKTSEEAQDTLNVPEAPLKKDDHAPEALGRFFAGHFGNRKMKRQAARTSTANFG